MRHSRRAFGRLRIHRLRADLRLDLIGTTGGRRGVLGAFVRRYEFTGDSCEEGDDYGEGYAVGETD